MGHTWTPNDDSYLFDAVVVVEQSGIQRIKFWSAVAGRLLPNIVVTADACKARWNRVSAQREAEVKSEEQEKAYKNIAAKAEAYEQDTLDWIVDSLRRIEDAQAAMRDEMVRMRRLWE